MGLVNTVIFLHLRCQNKSNQIQLLSHIGVKKHMTHNYMEISYQEVKDIL